MRNLAKKVLTVKKPGSAKAKPATKLKLTRKPEWYDYPQYFDLGFRDETEKEVQFLPLAFARFGTGKMQRILEPGCGSGRLVVRLAELGHYVAGLDLSDSKAKFLNLAANRKS